ncbi:hypothetical protein NEMBOFW57_000237 [Staphylotrichum longicolle]|uniref:Uncharacterized protein n=1 Tax=Staphylotrichum longicolle TaxID=669026 RepID=A0AAD4HWX2_9PEZI|nr:hypothetical protein NEMBOFW57_000237 [Staphylotrichum longicolle]
MAGRRPIDTLPHVVNDVVTKAFRAARPDGKGTVAAPAAAMETRIPAAVEKFNALLDELECELLLSKAVLERDLRQLRASRQPPPQEQKQVAPPAPMVIDLESPKMATKESLTGLPGPSLPGKQATKPVAPFPNMGFGGTSPEVATIPKPSPKLKDAKTLNRPAMAAAAAGRPASAPPKKETKVPPPQVPRPNGPATGPQAAHNSMAQAKAASVLAINRPASTPAVSNVSGPSGPGASRPASVPAASNATSVASTPATTGNDKLFTDMTFSLAPPSGDAPAQNPPPQQQRRASQPQANPSATDLTNFGGFSTEQLPSGPADVANMGLGTQSGNPVEEASMDSVDAKIDGLFDLGPGDIDNMDLEYDLGNGDNSNFNDMYFATGDSSGGTGEFDDAFFNLNG